MKKLIYIILLRYAFEKDYVTLGCDVMNSHGIETEIWTCVKWIYPKTVYPKSVYKGDGLFYIDGKQSLIDNIKRVKGNDTVFIIAIEDYVGDETDEIRRTIIANKMQYSDLYNSHFLAPEIIGGMAPEYRKLLINSDCESNVTN